jgi:hypothetical protein
MKYRKKTSKKKNLRSNKPSAQFLLLLFFVTSNAVQKTLYSIIGLFVGIAIFIPVALLCIISFTIQTQPDFSGYFADSILRPLIGTEATIRLEAFLFNLQDESNRLRYEFSKTDTHAIAETKTTPSPTPLTPDVAFHLSAIHPLPFDTDLPGEGVWQPIPVASDESVLEKTIYRPDKDRPYAIVTLVAMNMKKLSISAVAGLREPGGLEKPGTGMIPLDIQKSNQLVAAFNGGFQQKDGHYGMIVGKTEYLPLITGMATFMITQSGEPEIFKYTGQKIPSDLIVARQNAPLLIENSKVVTSDAAWNTQTWGLTTTNSMYTWRSGLGVTADGTLIYASGPSLVPETLAAALLAAGSVNAMQLDINSTWVRYVLFHTEGNGQYTYDALMPEMVNGGYSYLHGYQKDFFYLYKNDLKIPDKPE